MTLKLPDELYTYRLFCTGCTLMFMSEHKTPEELFRHMKTLEMVPGYVKGKDGVFMKLLVRSSAVVAIDQPLGVDAFQPNRHEQRKEQQQAPAIPEVGQLVKKKG